MDQGEDASGHEGPSELASPLGTPDGYPAPDHPVAEEISSLANRTTTLLWALLAALVVLVAIAAGALALAR